MEELITNSSDWFQEHKSGGIFGQSQVFISSNSSSNQVEI